MKLRRERQPLADELAIAVVAELYVAFDEGVALCRRLIEERFAGKPVGEFRGEALAGARHIAYASRTTLSAIMELDLLSRLSPELDPSRVLPALARIGYMLVALAEDAPEPEALLTQSELAGLGTQFGIEEWLARLRQLSGDAPQEEERR